MTPLASGAVHRLLVVLAALALLGQGGLEIAPRPGSAVSTSSAPAPATVRHAGRPATESAPAVPATTLRTALALAAPASAGDSAAGPGTGISVAPHLVAQPVVRPPTRSHVLGAGGGASGRGPPAPAGT